MVYVYSWEGIITYSRFSGIITDLLLYIAGTIHSVLIKGGVLTLGML